MPIDFWIPKPPNDQVFEELVHDVMARDLRVANLQIYGRSGQKQWGLDCIGRRNDGSLVGVQCKHHPDKITAKKLISEFTKDFNQTIHFGHTLGEFWFATSADRDTLVTDAVQNGLDSTRSVEARILFWEDIHSLLLGHPDLMHKYFTKHFPDRDLLSISRLELLSTPRTRVDWPITIEELEQAIATTLGDVPRLSPYSLSIGATTFPAPIYGGNVDLNLSLADLTDGPFDPPVAFAQAANRFTDLKEIIDKTALLSNELVVHPNLRLPYAYLLGWRFRRTSGYRLIVANRDTLWATNGLPVVPPTLVENKPIFLEPSSNEVALVLDVHRDTSAPVIDWANDMANPLFGVIHLTVRNGRIANAAEAMAIASEISLRIKAFYDNWGMKKVHLFGAIPAALAVMIGHNLNAINGDLELYYLDEDRTTIRHAGTITSNT